MAIILGLIHYDILDSLTLTILTSQTEKLERPALWHSNRLLLISS
jgi:hypothetical protein